MMMTITISYIMTLEHTDFSMLTGVLVLLTLRPIANITNRGRIASVV